MPSATGRIQAGEALRTSAPKVCRIFLDNGTCPRGEACHQKHLKREDAPTCGAFNAFICDPWFYAPCPRNESRCQSRHEYDSQFHIDFSQLQRVNVVLQANSSHTARLLLYLEREEMRNRFRVIATVPARCRRQCLHNVLCEAADAAAFLRSSASDNTLCRCLLRALMVGDAVVAGGREKLPEVGRVALKLVRQVAAASGTTEERPLVRLQGFPQALEQEVVAAAPSGASAVQGFCDMDLTRKGADVLLSVVYCRGNYLIGACPATLFVGAALHAAADALRAQVQQPAGPPPPLEGQNGASPAATPTGAVSRAWFKLEEASRRAGIVYDPSWLCLDMGASPGGWTQWLAGRCARVVAVDPALLAPAVLGMHNVVHVQARVEAAHEEIGVALGRPADVVVSDMNMPPVAMWAAVKSLVDAGLARPNALLVLTCKHFCRRKAAFQEQVHDVVRECSERYVWIETFRLLAGGEVELTIVAHAEAIKPTENEALSTGGERIQAES